ncbi:MAG: CRISPR-associated protein Cas4 [Bacteroidales bacterium]|nr:CRISPR-associated protein Cas4 [Bacteroidales bacterium]
MTITGTHFNYFMICHRKLWLFANGMGMEHSSEIVYEGKLIHEHSYVKRSEKFEEVTLGGIKVDYYDKKRKVIHEVKKSDKIDTAHEWQLKYYLYVFENAGIEGVTGILEYPKLRRTSEVILSERDREEIIIFEKEISEVIHSEQCPDKTETKICRNCSYYDFCFSGEEMD